MARVKRPLTQERIEHHNALALEFIADNIPTWLLHESVIRVLGFKRFILNNRMHNRGMADGSGKLWLAPVTVTKFRHTSPYSSPKGKADISPLGVFVHEMGHLVEFAMRRRKIRYHDEWWEIATTLRRQGITSYARTHPMEDFAETFRLWALNKKLLKELSPERYAFMERNVPLLLGAKVSAFKQKRADVQLALTTLVNAR